MRPTFYKGSKAAIIVFSHTDNQSYINIPKWYEDIKKYCGDIPIVLFGNKLDIVNEKDLDDNKVNNLVEENGFLKYYKTSAKSGAGVYEGFQAIIKELYFEYKDK